MSWYYSHQQASAGKEIEFQGKTYTVQELTEEAASEKFDYVLMSAGGGMANNLPLFSKSWSNCY